MRSETIQLSFSRTFKAITKAYRLILLSALTPAAVYGGICAAYFYRLKPIPLSTMMAVFSAFFSLLSISCVVHSVMSLAVVFKDIPAFVVSNEGLVVQRGIFFVEYTIPWVNVDKIEPHDQRVFFYLKQSIDAPLPKGFLRRFGTKKPLRIANTVNMTTQELCAFFNSARFGELALPPQDIWIDNTLYTKIHLLCHVFSSFCIAVFLISFQMQTMFALSDFFWIPSGVALVVLISLKRFSRWVGKHTMRYFVVKKDMLVAGLIHRYNFLGRAFEEINIPTECIGKITLQGKTLSIQTAAETKRFTYVAFADRTCMLLQEAFGNQFVRE